MEIPTKVVRYFLGMTMLFDARFFLDKFPICRAAELSRQAQAAAVRLPHLPSFLGKNKKFPAICNLVFRSDPW